MMIAERSFTVRVCGTRAASTARSHEVATSMLKRHVSGAPGSPPPTIPVASSFGASWRCA
jgi:hypothetical protein